MAEIACPECGMVTDLPVIRRSAEEFCGHCDYPLFWAPAAAPLIAGDAANDATLRRLPGAGGRLLIGTQVCPACGELNPLNEDFCIRCGTSFHPEPEPEPEPEPPPPLPPPEPEPEPRSWWWLWVALTVVAALAGGVFLALALT
jgi:Double zinc ribbon